MSHPERAGNELACQGCGDALPDGDLAYAEVFGSWDRDSQTYERGVTRRHYCSSCWKEDFVREAAAYHDLDDPDRLWNILEASDGTLVADTLTFTVGGRGWVTVIDGDVVAMHTTTEARMEDGQRIIEFGSEETPDFDEDRFYDLFDVPDRDDGMPVKVLLRPRRETPLADYVHVEDAQQRLSDQGGDA